jgi:hypothetical protein
MLGGYIKKRLHPTGAIHTAQYLAGCCIGLLFIYACFRAHNFPINAANEALSHCQSSIHISICPSEPLKAFMYGNTLKNTKMQYV